jgi:hypothetical protein
MAKALRGTILFGLCAAQLSACIAARPRDDLPTQLISAATFAADEERIHFHRAEIPVRQHPHERCHVVSSLIEDGVDLRNQARASVTAFRCAMARIRWMSVARAERF